MDRHKDTLTSQRTQHGRAKDEAMEENCEEMDVTLELTDHVT